MIPAHLQWLRDLPGHPLIVAEVKLRSPYGWTNPLGLWDAFELCQEVGDIISVHTDPLWGGSFEQLALLRCYTKKPILAKGFHPTIKHVEMALRAGATSVLTVGWWPDDERCWHEPESLTELNNSPAPRCVWNSRDPRTGLKRLETREMMLEANRSRWNHSGWLCQASNIRCATDVVSGIDAVLIGEGLYS